MSLIKIIDALFYFYFLLIILRIFLTWIPNLDWSNGAIRSLKSLTDPYLIIFKELIPPIGMLDFSPIVAIIVLQIVQTLVVRGLLFFFTSI